MLTLYNRISIVGRYKLCFQIFMMGRKCEIVICNLIIVTNFTILYTYIVYTIYDIYEYICENVFYTIFAYRYERKMTMSSNDLCVWSNKVEHVKLN